MFEAMMWPRKRLRVARPKSGSALRATFHEGWILSTGRWWRQEQPAVAAKARWFMNWHEFYALRLSGRPVVDWSDAGAWATYDVA
ncbi:MAG TPA: hypothetical protein VF383_09065, partial [Candidatus Dormibacteraeota bacterium]